ncbi:hypothetical protein GRI97_00655 [Altererythrobacter xixiisoli]|uniref:Lectin-like protein BA14k n=1 Tax=Croceibacterium xixiisoli TaxID=1476466 RepID=A0A6I4TRG6_9SPHN|nr:BA14K family protein [Croceibacterium xixiisoli]MXO97497.1 hypothetical protein [Croceibacterium xixiisoli]
MKQSKSRAIGAVLALACLAGLPGPASAQQQAPRPQASSSAAPRPAATRAAATPARQNAPAQEAGQQVGQRSGNAHPSSHSSNDASQYGNWNTGWGIRPGAPPAHWNNKGDWYRHVRACQQKFRSYRAATDTYRTNSGRTVRCTL